MKRKQEFEGPDEMLQRFRARIGTSPIYLNIVGLAPSLVGVDPKFADDMETDTKLEDFLEKPLMKILCRELTEETPPLTPEETLALLTWLRDKSVILTHVLRHLDTEFKLLTHAIAAFQSQFECLNARKEEV